ncbi:hypothetical protein QWJ34_09485 [Saccharibacillus sp. CPCC 101409]|uniref:hypothetical protein n=1 Tax=Saccharibacillus sp. CPCC 101409 TaxID=3058041 RepID=UPI002673BD73|nr:hypothetical protein [Saccharibacillus sp. CPCC 101409]MDO3409991.1 hypothetical protein [Saccharibacillus sp. CPCC 101409]
MIGPNANSIFALLGASLLILGGAGTGSTITTTEKASLAEAAVLLTAAQPAQKSDGGGAADKASTNLSAQKGTAGAARSGASSKTAQMQADAQNTFVQDGSRALADASAVPSSIEQMRFLNGKTGWIVRADSPVPDRAKQPLRLLTTRDGAASWSAERTMPGRYAAGLDPVSADSGWALVYDGPEERDLTPYYTSARIVHTSDGGRTWQTQWSGKANYQDTFPARNDLMMSSAKNGYAIVNGKLLTTTDGRSWKAASLGQEGFVPQHLTHSGSGNVWVSGVMPPRKGAVDALVVAVLHTTDGGKSWTRQLAAGPVDEENSDSSQLRSGGLDFADAKNGFLLTHDPSMLAGDLYRTSDGGKTWKKAQSKLRSGRPTLTALDFVDGRSGWIAASPGAGPIEGGLMMTSDGGKTFESSLKAGDDVSFAQHFADGNGYAVGTRSAAADYLVRTDDGGQSWSPVYPSILPAREISFVDEQAGFGLGTINGENRLLRTEDGGRTWTKSYKFGERQRLYGMDFIDRSEGWIAVYSTNEQTFKSKLDLLHTSDGGKSFETSALPAGKDATVANDRVQLRFADRLHGTLMYSDGRKVVIMRTADGGVTWSRSEDDLQAEVFMYALRGGSELQGFEMSGPGEETRFFRKKIGSGAWTESGRWNGEWSEPLAAVYPDADNGYLLALTDSLKPGVSAEYHLLVTQNGGGSWTDHPFDATIGLDEQDIRMDFIDNLHGWILTRGGLLCTEDGGRNWTLVSGAAAQAAGKSK